MRWMKNILTSLILVLCIGTTCAQTTSDSLIVDALRKKDIHVSRDNSVTRFLSGREKFDNMFAAIRQAQRSNHLE